MHAVNGKPNLLYILFSFSCYHQRCNHGEDIWSTHSPLMKEAPRNSSAYPWKGYILCCFLTLPLQHWSNERGKKRFPKPLAHKHLWHPAFFFLPVWMNRAKAGAEAAATATHETMQGNSDMGAAGTRRCGDDYTRAVPVGSRRITECLGLQWQRDDASAASALQELGFWVRGTEPFKVRQVKKKTKHWKEALGKRRVIKRRYLSLVLTPFSRPDLSLHMSG